MLPFKNINFDDFYFIRFKLEPDTKIVEFNLQGNRNEKINIRFSLLLEIYL